MLVALGDLQSIVSVHRNLKTTQRSYRSYLPTTKAAVSVLRMDRLMMEDGPSAGIK